MRSIIATVSDCSFSPFPHHTENEMVSDTRQETTAWQKVIMAIFSVSQKSCPSNGIQSDVSICSADTRLLGHGLAPRGFVPHPPACLRPGRRIILSKAQPTLPPFRPPHSSSFPHPHPVLGRPRPSMPGKHSSRRPAPRAPQRERSGLARVLPLGLLQVVGDGERPSGRPNPCIKHAGCCAFSGRPPSRSVGAAARHRARQRSRERPGTGSERDSNETKTKQRVFFA